MSTTRRYVLATERHPGRRRSLLLLPLGPPARPLTPLRASWWHAWVTRPGTRVD